MAIVVPDTVTGTEAKLLIVTAVTLRPLTLIIAPLEILTNPPKPNGGKDVIAIVVPETVKGTEARLLTVAASTLIFGIVPIEVTAMVVPDIVKGAEAKLLIVPTITNSLLLVRLAT